MDNSELWFLHSEGFFDGGSSSGGSFHGGDNSKGCGFTILLFILAVIIGTSVFLLDHCFSPGGWYWNWKNGDETTAVDTDSIAVEDTSYYEPSIPDTNECYQHEETVKHKHVPLQGSGSSSDDDKFDPDEKEAHEYDGLDDGEGDW